MIKFGKINLLVILLLILNIKLWAQHEDCDCPEHPGRISKSKIEKFDLIFKGNVLEIGKCQNNIQKVLFRGTELFKGDLIPRELTLELSCHTACSFEFNKNEEWLIYAHNDSTKEFIWTANVCERSRKYPFNIKEDSYTLYNEQTYEEEIKYLRSNVHPKPLFIENKDLELVQQEELTVIDANRDITIKDVRTKAILLGVSLAFVLAIFFVTKRWFKEK
ncbi:MAG TPA: hypothetical protein VIL57_05575 [Bacteroidia bacterium]